jgi:hypothetical protein
MYVGIAKHSDHFRQFSALCSTIHAYLLANYETIEVIILLCVVKPGI